MTVWIDTEKTDDISMHGCIYVPITKDRLMDFLVEYMKKVMSLAGMSSEAIDAEIANSTGVIEQMGLSSEEITDVGVHFATGWPLYVSNSRYVYSTVNGVNTTKQTHMEIEIILPE
jgi:spore maturation protein SpmB